MNILIVYERKNREYENAIYLKEFFERAGHECKVSQYYQSENFNLLGLNPPDIIFVPSLYNRKAIERTVARFGMPKRIINFQYEQVLSEKWEKHGHHNPKGLATQFEHICWGPKTAERLQNAGVPCSNIHLIGAVQLDLLNQCFLSPEVIRKTLAEQYQLPSSVKWKLFLSSFTYADISDSRLKMNENVAGASLSSFREIHTQSRSSMICWFEEALVQDPESIFIYRPHPDETNLGPIHVLAKKFSNFVILNENSAKVWIEASDLIISWYSTTVVESHYMNKPYAILRPHVLPDDFDSVLLKKGDFIQSKEEFIDFYLSDNRVKALSDRDVKDYYLNNSNELVANKILNIIELDRVIDCQFSLINLLSHRVKSFFVLFIDYFLVDKNNSLVDLFIRFKFLFDWKKEIESQKVSDTEKIRITESIREKIKRRNILS